MSSSSESATGAAARDVITGGFDGAGAGVGDRIDVSDIATFWFVGQEAFAGTGRSELRVEDLTGDTLVRGGVSGNGIADFEIRVEDALAGAFSSEDFIGLF